MQAQILPNLEKLQQDADVDVRYYAMTALQVWHGDEVMNMNP